MMITKKGRLARIGKILLEEFALLSTELVAILFMGVIAIVAFVKLSLMLVSDRVKDFDERIINSISGWYGESMSGFMKAMTMLGNPPLALIPILMVFIYFLFIRPHRWYAIKIPVIAAGSYLLNLVLKYYFERPRPRMDQRMVEVLRDLSFPSGHAMFAMAFYGLIIFIIWKFSSSDWIRGISLLLLCAIIFFIGLSRVYLKVHYPSDVLAGFAAGFIWLLLSKWLLNTIERGVAHWQKGKTMEPAG